MQTVFVDFSVKGKPREVARDARDPFDHTQAVEHLADAYSKGGKLIRMYALGPHVKPWRERKGDPLYESHYGKPTADYV
jgi:hypothetical protein